MQDVGLRRRILALLTVGAVGIGTNLAVTRGAGATSRTFADTPLAERRVSGGISERAASVPLSERAATAPTLAATWRDPPLSFESNQGQAPGSISFLAHDGGATVLLGTDGVRFIVPRAQPGPSGGGRVASRGDNEEPAPGAARPAGSVAMGLRLVGANRQARIVGMGRLPGKVNYVIGADPRHWRVGIATYARVAYRNVYHGVNLAFYGTRRGLEDDFVLVPGATPAEITLSASGADLSIDAAGNLLLRQGPIQVRQDQPIVYQVVGRRRQVIAGRYTLRGAGKVGFSVGRYDRRRPLVIDPVLRFATYLGGADSELGDAIAVDQRGAIYVSGYTDSAEFPASNPLQRFFGPEVYDAFVSKYSPDGQRLLYSTFYGGSDYDYGNGIAIDRVGDAYITGKTYSIDLPLLHAVQRTYGGGGDAFVAKLKPDGALAFSTYLGGRGDDRGNGVAVDGHGAVYLAGSTASPNFPLRDPLFRTYHGGKCRDANGLPLTCADAFVARLVPTKKALALGYSTYLGGDYDDLANAIAVNGAGNAYITGYTTSATFPTVHALQSSYGGGQCLDNNNHPARCSDAFVAELGARGRTLVFSTYLGGSFYDEGFGLALDRAGDVYIAGYTDSRNFAIANAAQDAGPGGGDGFVTKLGADGKTLIYSTYVGGGKFDEAYAIAADRRGNAYVVGYTFSHDFPVLHPLQGVGSGSCGSARSRAACWDAFVMRLNPLGVPVYSTYLGGSGDDAATAVAVDRAGSAYVTGYTTSHGMATAAARQSVYGGGLEDAFVAKIALSRPLAPSAAASAPARGMAAMRQFSFEPNRGQAAGRVRFLAHAGTATLLLTANEVVVTTAGSVSTPPTDQHPGETDTPRQDGVTSMGRESMLRLRLDGANLHAHTTGADRLPGVVNFFIGANPRRWQTNVPTCARVIYNDVYRGIDLIYSGTPDGLVYDFVLAPGADPGRIRLSLDGAGALRVDAAGNVLARSGGMELRQARPLVYQQIGRVRRIIPARLVLLGARRLGFALGAYDMRRPLIIDPVLRFSTYLGGFSYDEGNGVAVGHAGGIYVTGYTASTNFPTANAVQRVFGGNDYDAFVAKLSGDGRTLLYSTYLGGDNEDYGNGLAVDRFGDAYVAGTTYSTDFPTAHAVQPHHGGGTCANPAHTFTFPCRDAFVAELNRDGTGLVFSTYLGGRGSDAGNGLAVDRDGSVYVVGSTDSANFPQRHALQLSYGGGACLSTSIPPCTDAFVAKLSPRGASLVYSTYLGGHGDDVGHGIAVDSVGDAYVIGETSSANFPLRRPLQAALGGTYDAFVAELNSTGSALIYSTYLGGDQDEAGNGIAVDGAGNAYITGWTHSANFPTMHALQAVYGGGECRSGARAVYCSDAFIAGIGAGGAALLYSTYAGGAHADAGNGVAVDDVGNAYVVGYTDSPAFPTSHGLRRTLGGTCTDTGTGYVHPCLDAFVLEMNVHGGLAFSTLLGGQSNDWGNAIAQGGRGTVYITGGTQSQDFPMVGGIQPTFGAGTTDAFVLALSP